MKKGTWKTAMQIVGMAVGSIAVFLLFPWLIVWGAQWYAWAFRYLPVIKY